MNASELTPQQVYEQALTALVPQQRRFVEEYLQCLNGAEAVRRCGSKSKRPQQQAYEYLTKPDIKAAVAAGMALQVMGPSEVLARLSSQAEGTMSDFLSIKEETVTLRRSTYRKGDLLEEEVETVVAPVARLDLLKAAEAGKLHLIKKYSLDDKGKVSIELYDAHAAQALLAKHHGLLNDLDLTKLPEAVLRALAEGLGISELRRLTTQSTE